MLVAQELCCIRGDRELFRDLSFSAGEGDILHVTGPNGAGKTSLLRILAGLGRLESGTVTWQGKPINKQTEVWHQAMAWLGHQSGIKADLSPLENLRHLLALRGVEATEEMLDKQLKAMNLLRQSGQRCGELSAGQQRRVGLARLALSQAKLWILDEPWSALDAKGQALLNNLLAEHLDAGGIAIVTAHHGVEIPGHSVTELAIEPVVGS